MLPLVVIDFRVFCYHIVSGFETIAKNRDEETQKKWLKASWAIMLNRGITNLPYFPHCVVIADDCPPYWRTKYLEEKGFPLYKGGRKEKPIIWHQVEEAGKNYIFSKGSPLSFLKFEGYEADDIAGSIVRCQPKRTVILHTIDTDWLGLVKDSEEDNLVTEEQNKFSVYWNNLDQWTPRLRGKQEAIEYTKKRLKRDIIEAREIWKIKSQDGDKADNLIKGSPIEVIDLLSPPPQFDLLRKAETKDLIREASETETSASNWGHLVKASEWMERHGFVNPMYDNQIHPVLSDK